MKTLDGDHTRSAAKVVNAVETVEECCDDHSAVAYDAGFSAGFNDGLTKGYDLGCHEVIQSTVNRTMAIALRWPNISPQRSVALTFAVESIIFDGLPDNMLRQALLNEVQQAITAQENATKAST